MNWEFIIVDDASSNPRTYMILAHYEKLDPRIHVHLRYTHTGLVACRNYGILQAKGSLVAIVEDDDTIYP